MGHLVRGIRRLLLAATLALASLTGTALTAPAVHASVSPSLAVTGQGGGVYVQAVGFTSWVPVRIEVLNSTLTIVGSTQYLTPSSCYFGGCFATVLPAGFTGGAYVVADQAGWPTTWAKTTIYPDPYITGYTQSGPSSTTFVVLGSGYTPGASVTVKAWQLTCVPKFCFPRTLSSQTLSASVATPSDADYGLIDAGNVTVPAHSGWVDVSTTGGAISGSNVLAFYIP
jgi:hypothetical protein